MCSYKWLSNGQHMITVRNRETGYAKQYRYWNEEIISKLLARQDINSDVYITKYPKNRLVQTIILDFDSNDLDKAYADVTRMSNYLRYNGHNTVIVESGSKGYHLYIEIAPFLFKDTELRRIENWGSFFNAFVCFLIHDGNKTHYETLDKVNFSAGLNGNIRLIGSIHPKTHKQCQIIDGEFMMNQKPTEIQDMAQRNACQKMRIKKADHERILKQTKVQYDNDPIVENDLRVVFEQITGQPVKIFPKGYGYGNCPFHGDTHPSLLITKNWYSCSACGEKGNIWNLKKKGLVKFDEKGKAIL